MRFRRRRRIMGKTMTRLRALRVNRSRPLTLRDLAERTGFGKSHLSEVETGRSWPGARLVAALAKVYGRSRLTIRRMCEEARRNGKRTKAA